MRESCRHIVPVVDAVQSYELLQQFPTKPTTQFSRPREVDPSESTRGVHVTILNPRPILRNILLHLSRSFTL